MGDGQSPYGPLAPSQICVAPHFKNVGGTCWIKQVSLILSDDQDDEEEE